MSYQLTGKQSLTYLLVFLLPGWIHASPSASLKSKNHQTWNNDAVTFLLMRSTLEQFGFKIVNKNLANTPNRVLLDLPERATVAGKIVRVTAERRERLSINKFLECEIEYNRDAPALGEEWQIPVFVGIIRTHVDSGQSWKTIGKPIIRGQRQQPARPRTIHGDEIQDPGTYKVTIVVLGQEEVDGPWYLLDSYHGIMKIE